MTEISLKVKGLGEFVGKLDGAGRIFNTRLARAMQRGLAALQRKIQPYPPPPPESTYKRTGTLGRRWQAKVMQRTVAVQGILRNPTNYGPYVHGHETQAKVHVGRWVTDKQAAEDALPEIEGYFDAAVEETTQELVR